MGTEDQKREKPPKNILSNPKRRAAREASLSRMRQAWGAPAKYAPVSLLGEPLNAASEDPDALAPADMAILRSLNRPRTREEMHALLKFSGIEDLEGKLRSLEIRGFIETHYAHGQPLRWVIRTGGHGL